MTGQDGPVGLHEDVGRLVRGHAEALGGLDEGREDLVWEAFDLDPSVYDLDEDPMCISLGAHAHHK